jgi:hypothetical protein
MRVFALGIEHADGVTIKRLQRRNARELDGAAMFGGRRQHLGRRQDGRRATLSRRDGPDNVRYRVAQGRQLGAILQHDRLGKTLGPRHDATPQRNRDSSRRRMVGSGKDRAASEKQRPQVVPNEAVLLWGLMPEGNGTHARGQPGLIVS